VCRRLGASFRRKPTATHCNTLPHTVYGAKRCIFDLKTETTRKNNRVRANCRERGCACINIRVDRYMGSGRDRYMGSGREVEMWAA